MGLVGTPDKPVVASKYEANYVRYCFECGHIGEVAPGACCPDNKGSYVRVEVAEQAKAGFKVLYGKREARSDDELIDTCAGPATVL